MLTEDHKRQRVEAAQKFLDCHKTNGEEFLDLIVTGDETWVHYTTPETKDRSKQWKHTSSPKPLNFEQTLSAGKLIATVFWGRKGLLLCDFMRRGTTINSDRYCETLKQLRRSIQNKRRGMLPKGVRFHHDNARPHIAHQTTALFEEFGWELVSLPPYSPDVAPSDFNLFPELKKNLGGTKFQNDDELKEAVLSFLHGQAAVFFDSGFDKFLCFKGLIYLSLKIEPSRLNLSMELYGQLVQLSNQNRTTCVRSVVINYNREFENRAAIIVALRAGRSPKEIVDFLKLPKTTIYRVKKQFDEADSNKEGIATRKKHSRRSDRVRGEGFVKNVKEKIDGNPGKSMRAIAKEMDVGSMTIVRTIHEDLGLKSYALRKGQLLTENMKNNRKGKAAALLNNLKHDSFGMLRFFSDEKNFDVDQKLCRLPPRLHGRVDIESRQDCGRQGTSKQVDHCLYRKMEQGREEDSKEPMKTDPDYESGDNPTFPKKETTLGRTQEIVPSQEDVTPPPPVSDVLGRLTTTLHQLSAVTGHRERWNRYDGSYEAQSFFTNYDAQADRAQLQYSTRLRKPPNLLQAPLRVTHTRASIYRYN
ncbi:hypothetical protein LAZ67_9003640 [Cordylochernes scorpioides]|uniref:Transposase n=1 Tax=Cordylochernes scorpioides TaxID=51811 RepID=A0ABY6KUM0_9ARAC|nr:hypothetical protein LAZ67_9003640 [Cordylochernes scorpioides]